MVNSISISVNPTETSSSSVLWKGIWLPWVGIPWAGLKYFYSNLQANVL